MHKPVAAGVAAGARAGHGGLPLTGAPAATWAVCMQAELALGDGNAMPALQALGVPCPSPFCPAKEFNPAASCMQPA